MKLSPARGLPDQYFCMYPHKRQCFLHGFFFLHNAQGEANCLPLCDKGNSFRVRQVSAQIPHQPPPSLVSQRLRRMEAVRMKGSISYSTSTHVTVLPSFPAPPCVSVSWCSSHKYAPCAHRGPGVVPATGNPLGSKSGLSFCLQEHQFWLPWWSSG